MDLTTFVVIAAVLIAVVLFFVFKQKKDAKDNPNYGKPSVAPTDEEMDAANRTAL